MGMRTKNVLLSGKPGVGKTTVIRQVVEMIGSDSASGFFTQEMREGNRRVGFALETLAGERGVLAHVSYKGPHRIGKYGVDLQVLESLAVPAIDPDITDSELLVIDEIGKMECLSSAFAGAVLRALTSDRLVVGTVPAKGNSFVREVTCRGDVELIEVTLKNRNALAGGVLRTMGLGNRK
jgi:nucleoside-triphosphatase